MNRIPTVRKILSKKCNNDRLLLSFFNVNTPSRQVKPSVLSYQFIMFLRVFIAFCLFTTVSAVTMAICQEYCSSVNGGNSYENCSPWRQFSTNANLTCYNLCVHNCAAVYDGSCMTGNNFRCCLATTPAKTQEFKVSGCNTLYNNL